MSRVKQLSKHDLQPKARLDACSMFRNVLVANTSNYCGYHRDEGQLQYRLAEGIVVYCLYGISFKAGTLHLKKIFFEAPDRPKGAWATTGKWIRLK